MRPLLAVFIFLSSFFSTIVVFQLLKFTIVSARQPRYFPAPSIPNILTRFQQYAKGDAAELEAWFGVPFLGSLVLSDIDFACRKLGFEVDTRHLSVVIAAVDLDGDQAVSLIDAAYGIAAASQTWHLWKGRSRTAHAVRGILRAVNISNVSQAGLENARILPHAKYPLQLLGAIAGSAVLATLEEAVHAWWPVLDDNNNGRLDMSEMMTLAGARWAARLGTTKAQALQHAARTSAFMQAEIQEWIYKK
jgi:hypothetical protein